MKIRLSLARTDCLNKAMSNSAHIPKSVKPRSSEHSRSISCCQQYSWEKSKSLLEMCQRYKGHHRQVECQRYKGHHRQVECRWRKCHPMQQYLYHPIKEATLHSIAYQLINLHTCSHIIITHTESELLTTGTIVL